MSSGTVIFSNKERLSTTEIGKFLITIGEKLAQGGSFSLKQGDRELRISPVGVTSLELEYKIKNDKNKFEIEIKWKPSSGEISIGP